MALNDSYQLSQDPVFQNRVQAALLTASVAISNEGWTVAFHRERASFAVQILAGSGGAQAGFVTLFTNAVATDTTCLSDATQAGTVQLTSANRGAQALLVTDVHINNAVSAMFNSFIREPQN